MLAWRAGWCGITARRRGRRQVRRWPERFPGSTRDVRSSATGSSAAWARRWRARRRSAGMTAGGVAVPAGGAFLPGFFDGALTWPGTSRARPWSPASASAWTSGWRRSRSSIPSVRSAATSCIRPGRNAPSHSSRPWPSLTAVDSMVFCFFLPDTNARRPGRPRWGPAHRHLRAIDPELHALEAALVANSSQAELAPRRVRPPPHSQPTARHLTRSRAPDQVHLRAAVNAACL